MSQRLLFPAAFALALTLVLPASAFREPRARVDFVPEGAWWIAGHGDASPHSALGAPPAAFRERHGEAWTQRKHGPNGTFRHIWGEGIEVDVAAMDDDAAALGVAETFWREHEDLLPGGVTVEDLQPWSNVLTRGTRYVSHHQTVHGVPVLRAGAFLAIKEGRVVWLGVQCFPGVSVDTAPGIAADEAIATAKGALGDLGAAGTIPGEPSLAIFPYVYADRFEYRLVWAVELKGAVTGRWTAYVDAREDIVLALRDERMFLDATVELEHHDRNPGGAIISSPAPYLYVEHDDGADYADANGAFSTSGSSTSLDLEIRGAYIDVSNEEGSEITTGFGGIGDGDVALWVWADTEFDQAQLDAYRFGSDVRDFAQHLDPSVSISNERMNIKVNYDDSCNAWFDGNITTLQEGDYPYGDYTCNNTAMVADVVYHEYGHGFHFYSVIWGVGDYYGDVGEGFADTMAFLQTGDSTISPYFITNGWGIREVETDLVWPTDVVGEVHADGLIVGGSIWDLRTLLIEEYGEADGQAIVEDIFAGMCKTSTDIPSTYTAALEADDDNGNLADGTPHFCQIHEAFGRHGLVDVAVDTIDLLHDPIQGLVEWGEPIEIEATATPANPECFEGEIEDVRLVWSLDGGGTWDSVDMASTGGGAWAAELPAVPYGTQLRYRVEADDEAGGSVTARPKNPADPGYYAYAGELEEIFCIDFEEESTEWTHELLSGQQTEGADDWMRGTPTGNGGDPDHAYSGLYAWGNDLALEENWDGLYQNSKINALYSPEWDLGEYDTVRLQFRRWLGVEDATYDFGRIYVNDDEVWSNAVGDGGVHHEDYEWILFDLDITDQAAGESSVQIRWEIESDAGLQFGGWTIDDVCLYQMLPEPEGDDDDDDDGDDDDGGGVEPTDEPEITVSGGCECHTADRAAPFAALPFAALLALLGLRRR